MKKGWIITSTAFFIIIVTAGFVVTAASQLIGMESAGVININTATEDQLRMLPLIDDKLAKAIIKYRDSNGPFDSINQLKNIKGVTKETFDELRSWLVVKGDMTFSPELFNEIYGYHNFNKR